MKNLLLIIATMVVCSAAAQTKKITVKDLQGVWKIKSVENIEEGIIFNLQDQTFKYDTDAVTGLSEDEIKNMQQQMKNQFDVLNGSFIVFDGASLTHTVSSEQVNGTFELKDSHTEEQVIITSFPTGRKEQNVIRMQKNELHFIVGPDTPEIEFIYTR